MTFTPAPLPGVIVIESRAFRDARGFFLETYQRQRFFENGITDTFVQDNHSRSTRHTLRGLHAQLVHPQTKLVRVVKGEIYDVIVDIRPDSPTYKKWFGITLSDDNAKQCYVPVGYAHGFCVISETADVEYKVSDYYDPAHELHLLWNDPDLAIAWPVQHPLLSPKDANGVRLRDIEDRLPTLQPRIQGK